MGYGFSAARAYGNVGRVAAVNGAGPLDIVVLLYDRAIELLGAAKSQIELQDWAGKGVSIGKANDIINELTAALDMENGGEIATNLSDLYGHMVLTLADANLNRDAVKVNEVKNLLGTLRDAWGDLARKQPRSTPEVPHPQRAMAA